MRIAHITDIHVERRPSLAELGNKRLAGAVNLYLLGRSAHFTPAAQAALVRAVEAKAPDLVLCTGDLTATATEAEFEAAAELVAPLRARFPWLAIPGNHDVYTGESLGRFARHFGPVEAVAVHAVGEVDVVLVDVCHPDWLSRGWLGAEGLDALEKALAGSDRPALVALHYPLRGRRGDRYAPSTRACIDAEAIEATIARHARVRLVVHGHEHHGFRTAVAGAAGEVPIIDPGAGGYAFLPAKHRTAHFCIYIFEGGTLSDVQRFAFDGVAFGPEAGGAFATGG
jgi:3',5'-cyclic AMP phosphodiesterase CpdA